MSQAKDWRPKESKTAELLKKKIEAAIKQADDAFWAEIAKSFPEVKTGDLPAEISSKLGDAQDEAVYWWLMFNHPHHGLVRMIHE